MYYVRFKPGVEFRPMLPAAATIIAALFIVAQQLRRDVLVSCGSEGHGPESRHTKGEAVDVSVKGWDPADVVKLFRALQTTLGPVFTVLCESPVKVFDPVLKPIVTINPNASALHLHLQPVKGTTYPPAPVADKVNA